MDDPDPLRKLPRAQQRQVHRAVILGRPVTPELAAAAAGHARHLRWVLVVGVITAVIGAAMVPVTAFAPHATWSSWLTPAGVLICAPFFLFFGFNARRVARADPHLRS